MYSESVVAEKSQRFFEKYKLRLTPHSVDEVDRFNIGLKKLEKVDSKGSTYFDDSLLTPAMKRFIQNERALAALSAEYFLTRYYWLTETDIQHFTFRKGQRAFFNILGMLEDKGSSQEIQCLKSRKIGISTVVEGLMTHASLMVPGTRASIGSADEQKTQVMMEMMYGALEHIPWWLSPTQTKDKRSGRALLQFCFKLPLTGLQLGHFVLHLRSAHAVQESLNEPVKIAGDFGKLRSLLRPGRVLRSAQLVHMAGILSREFGA